MAEAARQLEPDYEPDDDDLPEDDKPDWYHNEHPTGGGESSPPAGDLKSVPDESSGDRADPKVKTETDPPANWKYDQEGADQKSLAGQARKRRKQLAGAAMFVAVLFAMGGIILHLLSSSLKLPHLDAHLDRRAAKYARTAAKRQAQLTTEKLAVAATQDTLAEAMARRTAIGRGLDRLDVQRVVNRAKARGVVEIHKTKGFFGGKVTGITVNGEFFPKPQFDWRHPAQYQKDLIKWTSDWFNAWNDSLGTSVARSVRVRAGKLIVREVGGRLLWWPFKGAAERGKTRIQAMLDQLRLQRRNIAEQGSKGARIDREGKAAADANEELNKCAASDACGEKLLRGQVKPGEIAKPPVAAYAKELENAYKLYPAPVQPLVILTIMACVVEETAQNTATAVVQANQAEAIKTYLAIKSASQQQKKGDTTGEAVGGFNDILGDITWTNPEKLARNEPIDTTAETFAQSSRVRGYHYTGILSWILAPFHPLCPLIFQPVPMMALMILTLLPPKIATIDPEDPNIPIPFIRYPAALAVGTAARRTVERLMSNVLVRALSAKLRNLTLRDLTSSMLKFGVGYEASDQALSGLQKLIRLMVLSEMGGMVNGLDPKLFVNEADMGAVAYNNDMDRIHNYGRPLTISENKTAEKAALQAYDGRESFFQRHLALSNPTSSVSNTIINTDSYISHPGKITHALAAIPRFFGRMFLNLFRGFNLKAYAADSKSSSKNANVDTENYNIMQWGWTPDEENTIDTNPTYDILINAEILRASGQEGAIEKAYGECYTVDYADLVTKPELVHRDETTGTPDGGKCSSENLNYNNTRFDNELCADDPLLQQTGLNIKRCDHLVFRWRYNHSLLVNLVDASDYETASKASPPANTGGPLPGTSTIAPNPAAAPGGFHLTTSNGPNGISVFPLDASQDVIKRGSGEVWCYTQRTNCHHDYNAADLFAPTGTAVVSPGDCVVESAKDAAQYPAAYGSRVQLRCGDRLFYMAHMGIGTLVVHEGQHLSPGDAIGRIGTSAQAEGTSPHLHIDALPASQYPHRPACSSGSCSSLPFIDIQSELVDAFGAVP